MNNRQDTNLAYKINDRDLNRYYSQLNFDLSAIPKIPDDIPDRRREEYERAKRKRRIQERQVSLKMRSIYRAVGIERAKSIFSIIAMILIVASLFAFVMVRQSSIVEQNFSNTRLENKVSEIQEKNRKDYEDILSQINLNDIEQQAFQLYGLRKPAQSQRIHMNLPYIDQVVRYNKDGTEMDEGSEDNTIVFDASQIETYMKRLRLQD